MFALLNYSHTSSFANLPYESKWHAYQPQTNVWETYATGGNQFHPEACEHKGVCSLRLQFSLRPSCAPPRCCAMLMRPPVHFLRRQMGLQRSRRRGPGLWHHAP